MTKSMTPNDLPLQQIACHS